MPTPYAIGSSTSNLAVSTVVITVGTVSGTGSPAISTTAGDAIVVAASVNSLAQTILSVADSQGNTYTRVSTNSAQYDSSMFVALNTHPLTQASGDTITVTYSSAVLSARNAAAIGCSGVLAVSAVDNVPTPTNSAGSTTPSITTGTLAQASEVVVAWEDNAQAGGAMTWAAPFSPPLAGAIVSAANQESSISATVTSATTAVTASGTIISAKWAMMAVTLKLAVTGPGTWSLVQKSTEATASASSVTPAFGGATAAGNLLVACLIQGGGNAWTLPAGWVQGPDISNGGISHASLFYFINNPGGITSVVCSTTGTPNIKAFLLEFFNTDTTPTVTLNSSGTGTAGAVATLAVTGTTSAVAGDLAVCVYHEHFTAATAITWTDPAGFTLGQADTASAGNHLYGGYNLSVSAGSLTVTGTSSVASPNIHGWAGVIATFGAVGGSGGGGGGGGGGGTGAGLVGAYVPTAPFGAGTTQAQAISNWQTITGRSLDVRRVYFPQGQIPAAITTDLIADAAAGRKAAISMRPAYNPPSPTDLAALDTFLASCKSHSLNAVVSLWQEPYNSSQPSGASPGLTVTLEIAAWQFYASTIRKYYPTVFNTSSFAVVNHNENAYYPGDAYIDEVATDFYCSEFDGGIRLDQPASIADGAVPPKPFGLWEMTNSTDPSQGQTQSQATAYWGYVQSYFTARLAAGKTNADILVFNSNSNLNQETAIISASDYRVPLYQQLYDALSGGLNQLSMASEVDLVLDVATVLATTVTTPPAQGTGTATQTFPQLFLELGMPAASPVAAPSVFILDDPVFGKLDTARLGNATTWVDITSFLRSGTVTRPATRVQGPLLTYQAATLSVVLKNGDGRFDPDNLSGPYVTVGVSQVRPMVPVRLRAVWNGLQYFLFHGFADAWQDDGANYAGHYAETALSATDGFKVLNGVTLPPLTLAVGSGETSGARIRRILTAAHWYTDHRKVATGDSTVQSTTFGDTAGNLLQVTADSEIGELYVDGAGYLVFRNRHAILTDTRSTVPQGVFGDQAGTVETAGTEEPYVTVGRADDDTTLANDIQITNVGGSLQEAQNTASIARYLFPRTYSRSDTILQTDADALNYAGWVLGVSTDAEDRFDTLTLLPARDATDLFPQALGREIGDRIQVWRRPPGAGTVTKDCFVRGITHTFDAGLKSWQTIWDLQDAAKYASFFILDDPVNGRLDHSKLAF